MHADANSELIDQSEVLNENHRSSYKVMKRRFPTKANWGGEGPKLSRAVSSSREGEGGGGEGEGVVRLDSWFQVVQ